MKLIMSEHQDYILHYGRLLIDLYAHDVKNPLHPPHHASGLMSNITSIQKKIMRNHSDNPDIDFYKFVTVKTNEGKSISLVPLSLLVLPLARLVYSDEDAIFKTALCRVAYYACKGSSIINSYKWLELMIEMDLIEVVDSKSISCHVCLSKNVVDTFFGHHTHRKIVRKNKYSDRFNFKKWQD